MTPIRERIRREDAQRVRVPHPEQPKQAVSAKIFKACKGSPTGVPAAMRGRPNPEAGRAVGNRKRQTRAALQKEGSTPSLRTTTLTSQDMERTNTTEGPAGIQRILWAALGADCLAAAASGAWWHLATAGICAVMAAPGDTRAAGNTGED